MIWDGIERRTVLTDGYEGRRSTDWHCPDHAQIQENTKEHRSIVCGKIKMVKDDAEKDLAELRAYHDDDMKEIKDEMEKKAGVSDLRGMMRMVSILISLAVLVIAGQAVWLKSDIGKVKDEISDVGKDVGAKIQRLNQRVTEGVDDRIRMDLEQTKQLENISGEMRVVSWRLSQLEDAHKVK